MTESVTSESGIEKRKRNLRPYKAGQSGNPSGKRKDGSPAKPRIKALRECILADAEKRGADVVITDLLKRRPDLYFAYGWGKPAETVLLGGADAPPVQIEEINAASALARKNRGIDVPT